MHVVKVIINLIDGRTLLQDICFRIAAEDNANWFNKNNTNYENHDLPSVIISLQLIMYSSPDHLFLKHFIELISSVIRTRSMTIISRTTKQRSTYSRLYNQTCNFSMNQYNKNYLKKYSPSDVSGSERSDRLGTF